MVGFAFVAPPVPDRCTSRSAAAGIKFIHYRGNDGIPINREIFGPGVCVADFDGDGFQDIYFVNGRDLYGRGVSVRNALYHNNGDGTFTDVTEKAGVAGTGYGFGCVWGDYDNDGFPDLFVTHLQIKTGLRAVRRPVTRKRESSLPYWAYPGALEHG